jgi:hypothetical protein
MYGCNNPNDSEETRIFPFLLSQICPFFTYKDSRFGNQKSKESTAEWPCSMSSSATTSSPSSLHSAAMTLVRSKTITSAPAT